ncbi:hypothetical protein Q1695_002005 [Nippostrongylus brasiliensis]|nr:hypothetical protein Q1695_002005 [Nippostrongylus brasiliensis]
MSVAELSINVDCDYAQTLVFGSIEYTSMAIFCITLSVLILAYILTHRIATATIRTPRKLNSPFYLLFLHDRILVLVFSSYCSLTYRLPMTGLVTLLICGINASAITTTIYTLEYYLQYAAIYSSVAISVMRVAAVLYPVGSQKLQVRLSIVLLVFVYSLPWVTTWFLIPAVAYYTPITDTASVVMTYIKVFENWRNSLVLLIVTGIGCFMNVACFFITITRWRTLASKRDPLLVRRSERSLMLMTFSICISLSINLLIQLLFYYAVYADVVFFIKGFVYDMLLLLPTFTFYFTHPIFSSKTNFEQHSTPVDAKPADAKPGAAAGAKPEEMKTAKKEEATDKKNPTQETSQKDAPKEPKEGDTKKEETTDKKTADATQTQSTAQTMKTQGAASAKGDEAKKTQKSGADDDKKDSDKK